MGKLKELFEKWWNTASDEDKQHYYVKLKHLNDEVKKVWLAVNENGQEVAIISTNTPHRMPTDWWTPYDFDSIVNHDIHYLDDGYIENYLGRKLTWTDEPVEI